MVDVATMYGNERPVRSESSVLANNLDLTAHSGLLPPVVRWISRFGHGVILERPPQKVTLSYYGVKRNDVSKASKEQLYELPLPWMVYGIMFDGKFRPRNLRVYGRKAPIQDAEDELMNMPLPNLYANGEFCLPQQTAWHEDPKTWTLAEGIVAAYNQIWNTGYNTDITDMVVASFQHQLPRQLFEGKPLGEPIKAANLFTRWEKADPAAVVKWDWLAPTETFESLCMYLTQIEQQQFGIQMVQAQLRSGAV